MARLTFETIPCMAEAYGEPCSNCIHSEEDCFCNKGHRQKWVNIESGHIPEVRVRKEGGCPDHEIKEGDWWNEDPIGRCCGEYGGSKTSIL